MNPSNVSYPGNRDLPAEVRDRVLTTFRQTADLFREGRIDEVQHGCDLILQMDPAFAPAKKLIEKLRNPAAPIDIDSLTAGLTSAGSDRLIAAREALSRRDFSRAVELASEVLRSELTNEEAQQIGREAQDKIEAAPFVEQFLGRARAHLSAGNVQAARADIEKARALDADHPMVRQIENMMATMPVAQPAPAPPPESSFTLDPPAGEGGGSSFIVEAPAPAARTSQASDFGFSFEEDAGGGSHFDFSSPASAPGPEVSAGFGMGEAQTFDFSTASAEGTDEDQLRIEQYLADGDQAEAAGDLQRATEIWSRIFLIDVTHQGASERIERARKGQLEVDQQVDALAAEATRLLDEGDADAARERYQQILRLDPTNQTAADFLDKGSRPAPQPAHFDLHEDEPGMAEVPHRTEQDLAAAYGIPMDTEADIYGTLEARPATAPQQAATPTKRASRRGGALVLVGALLLLGVGGYFAYTKLFGGASSKQASGDSQLILNRAQALAKQGRFDQAIALLSSIGPNDPDRDRALALMAEIRTQKASGPAMVDGRPALEVFEELLGEAQTASATRDYLRAKEAFDRAAKIRPIPAEHAASYQIAQQQVAKLQSALALFKEGNYTGATEVLEGLAQDDPENPNVRQLMVNARFNIGTTALREEKLEEAIAEFERVLQLAPEDEGARRSRDIAIRYKDQPKDLLYRIYVKYLPLR